MAKTITTRPHVQNLKNISNKKKTYEQIIIVVCIAITVYICVNIGLSQDEMREKYYNVLESNEESVKQCTHTCCYNNE